MSPAYCFISQSLCYVTSLTSMHILWFAEWCLPMFHASDSVFSGSPHGYNFSTPALVILLLLYMTIIELMNVVQLPNKVSSFIHHSFIHWFHMETELTIC